MGITSKKEPPIQQPSGTELPSVCFVARVWMPSRLSEAEIVRKGSDCLLLSDPNAPVYARSFKMSKSRGNVVNPDDIVFQYGADSLRLYEMFMGPLTDTKVIHEQSLPLKRYSN